MIDKVNNHVNIHFNLHANYSKAPIQLNGGLSDQRDPNFNALILVATDHLMPVIVLLHLSEACSRNRNVREIEVQDHSQSNMTSLNTILLFFEGNLSFAQGMYLLVIPFLFPFPYKTMLADRLPSN